MRRLCTAGPQAVAAQAELEANPKLENWTCPICKKPLGRSAFQARPMQHHSRRFYRPFHTNCGADMTPEQRYAEGASVSPPSGLG